MKADRPEPAAPILPAGRSSVAELSEQIRRVSAIVSLSYLSDFPVAILVLNADRQIVYANAKAAELMAPCVGNPLGLRPGEAFGCANAALGTDGCGTGSRCRYCGAARSLAAAISGMVAAEECGISRAGAARLEQLDLLVWSKRIVLQSDVFYLFSVMDISERKRRESLERIFLHDLMNTAGALSSLMRLVDPAEATFAEYFALAREASDQLVDELVSHRMLSDAEAGSLPADSRIVSASEVAESVADIYRRIAESRGVSFRISHPSESLLFSTDPTLLKRVLSNLIKNALEASVRGKTVAFSYGIRDGRIAFSVSNDAVIPDEVRSQLFRRSFSTKARGRGLGTYAARLFTEEFLNGSIEAASEAGKGTVFTVYLPFDPTL